MTKFKSGTVVSTLFFRFLVVRCGESAIGEYQLMPQFDHDAQAQESDTVTEATPQINVALRDNNPEDWPPPMFTNSEDYARLVNDDPILKGVKNFSARLCPYDIEPIEFDNLFMGYYNRQPKRALQPRKKKRNAAPLYDGTSSLNDFTKDHITEIMDYKTYLELVKGKENGKRKKRQALSFNLKGDSGSSILEKFDDLYKEIIKDTHGISQLHSGGETSSNDLKRCAQYDFKTSRICCNPEKPSIVLDSRSSPSQMIHIDRNTIEEIIQVGIPNNNSQVKCSSEQPAFECGSGNRGIFRVIRIASPEGQKYGNSSMKKVVIM